MVLILPSNNLALSGRFFWGGQILTIDINIDTNNLCQLQPTSSMKCLIIPLESDLPISAMSAITISGRPDRQAEVTGYIKSQQTILLKDKKPAETMVFQRTNQQINNTGRLKIKRSIQNRREAGG